MKKNVSDNWEQEFRLLRFNPIYFIEAYWNMDHPNNPVQLSDEEKQCIYERYKSIPVFDNYEDYNKWEDRKDELRKAGKKDWEMFL